MKSLRGTMATKAMVVFMRYPEPGRVKSRLAAAVGTEEACRVYEKLTRITLGVTAEFQRERPDVHVWVYFTPDDKKHLLEQGYPGPWRFAPQRGGHLGERMGCAVREMLHRGYRHVLLVGTDLANLETGDFHEAFNAMDRGFAVLGPAADGGFYSIGLDRPCPSAFSPETWGTNDVFARTEQLVRKDGLSVHLLKTKKDIDRPEDLQELNGNLVFQSGLSVIIPTLGTFEELEERLVIPLQHRLWPDDEIVVVRGVNDHRGETWRHGPRVIGITSPVGRGIQLNAGARAAKGDVLLFLHDDCMPPPNAFYTARRIAAMPRMSLGCFRLSFVPSSRPMDLIAQWANIRTRWLKLPYGDQGLFCRREVFERVGGFKKPYLMEDVDLAQRSRQWGDLLICPDEMLASPHRYLNRGILRTSMLNHAIMLLHHLGVDDRKLYSLYYGD
jgi:hypothetical protein